jgi:hypothetical protein
VDIDLEEEEVEVRWLLEEDEDFLVWVDGEAV